MKNVKALLSHILVIIIAATTAGPVCAQFEEKGCGARAAGLANAYTAGASGPEAMYYNPAGLTGSDNIQAMSSYSRLFWGLTDDSNLGKGFIGISMPAGPKTALAAGYDRFFLAEYYSESIYYLSAGRTVSSSISLGLNIKILEKRYESNAYTQKSVRLDTGQVLDDVNPVFRDGYSVTNYTVDAGCTYGIADNAAVALMLRNITSPDMALSPDDEDRLLPAVKAGFEYDSGRMKILSDVESRGSDIGVAAGAEKWFFDDSIALRSGAAVGSRRYRSMSLGMSFRHKDMYGIDYGFSYPLGGIRQTYGTHEISFTVEFGKGPPVPVKTGERQ
ncbi:MAG: hypothetical protein JXJ19_00960 [Elusimicrobia bacterium]|nr:hypothetical protein [Elusimicrobiota bacterium]